MRHRIVLLAAAAVLVATGSLPLGGQLASRPARKQVLAWADVRNGYQHESISHALATIERLGDASGAFDTYIRTDSQLVTKRPITFRTGTGIATGEQFLVRNLDFFDAIFFFGVREIDLTAEQRADLLSFVRDDGKGFVAAHSGATAFFSWPEFGRLLGGRFDEHPWGITEARVVIEDPAFPAMRHFPAASMRVDEHYQIKDFSRADVRVLARLDPASVDLEAPLVHRTDGDFPVAWAKTYGKGRVFYSTLGHARETWDDPAIQTMYFEALRWALGLVEGDAAPRQPQSATDDSTLARGKALTDKLCTACHDRSTATSPGRGEDEWRRTVYEMAGMAGTIDAEDAEPIISYLSRTYPAK